MFFRTVLTEIKIYSAANILLSCRFSILQYENHFYPIFLCNNGFYGVAQAPDNACPKVVGSMGNVIFIGAAIACNLCSGASLWEHNFQGYGRIFLGVVEDDFHIPHIEGNQLENFL